MVVIPQEYYRLPPAQRFTRYCEERKVAEKNHSKGARKLLSLLGHLSPSEQLNRIFPAVHWNEVKVQYQSDDALFFHVPQDQLVRFALPNTLGLLPNREKFSPEFMDFEGIIILHTNEKQGKDPRHTVFHEHFHSIHSDLANRTVMRVANQTSWEEFSQKGPQERFQFLIDSLGAQAMEEMAATLHSYALYEGPFDPMTVFLIEMEYLAGISSGQAVNTRELAKEVIPDIPSSVNLEQLPYHLSHVVGNAIIALQKQGFRKVTEMLSIALQVLSHDECASQLVDFTSNVIAPQQEKACRAIAAQTISLCV